jgi:glycosyltransferase involved in cell wall biosynthesis
MKRGSQTGSQPSLFSGRHSHSAIAHQAYPATVSFIVNGGYNSAMGCRARDLATHLGQYDIRIAYRSPGKLISILKLFVFLTRVRPAVIYVFDLSYSGVVAAGVYRVVFGSSLIIETGDAIVELARSTGSRSRLGLWLTGLLEKTAFAIADRVVVRGSFHKEWLSSRGVEAEVIQDGVETSRFTPAAATHLRVQYGLDGALTVGLVGTSIWSEKLQMCYGWELVETLKLLKGERVHGIMIGNGSGIPHLKARCREYGIENRITFLDYVPYDQLPRYLNLIDVCLSTQTNDVVGKVRTTGKLPLYLAAARYVLASDVGEAARVLDPEMLVPYEGVKDEQYPQKLATRIKTILDSPEILDRAGANIALAENYFDYSLLAKRLGNVIEAAIHAARKGS